METAPEDVFAAVHLHLYILLWLLQYFFSPYESWVSLRKKADSSIPGGVLRWKSRPWREGSLQANVSDWLSSPITRELSETRPFQRSSAYALATEICPKEGFLKFFSLGKVLAHVKHTAVVWR